MPHTPTPTPSAATTKPTTVAAMSDKDEKAAVIVAATNTQQAVIHPQDRTRSVLTEKCQAQLFRSKKAQSAQTGGTGIFDHKKIPVPPIFDLSNQFPNSTPNLLSWEIEYLNLTGFTTLNLRNNRLDNSAALNMAKKIAVVPSLVKIDISGNPIDERGQQYLSNAIILRIRASMRVDADIAKLKSTAASTTTTAVAAIPYVTVVGLTELDLSTLQYFNYEDHPGYQPAHSFPTATELEKLFTGSVQPKTLTRISFRGIPIDIEMMKVIASVLTQASHLEILDLGYCDLTIAAIKILGPALTRHPSLKILQLNGNSKIAQDNNKGIEILSDNLLKNNTLQELDLSSIPIYPQSLAALFKVITANPALQTLDLSGAQLCVNNLAAFLKTNPALKHLLLNNCGLQAADAGILVAALQHNNRLIGLAIENNNLKEGAKEFGKLALNTQFKVLLMAGNQIDAEGITAICNSLTTPPLTDAAGNSMPLKLQTLSIGNNLFGDQGAQQIANFIENPLCVLTEFAFNGAWSDEKLSKTDGGLVPLGNALARNKTITTVCFPECFNPSLTALAAAVKAGNIVTCNNEIFDRRGTSVNESIVKNRLSRSHWQETAPTIAFVRAQNTHPFQDSILPLLPTIAGFVGDQKNNWDLGLCYPGSTFSIKKFQTGKFFKASVSSAPNTASAAATTAAPATEYHTLKRKHN